MIQTLKSIFGFGPKVDYKDLLANGAQIIDVRTKGEFQSGHIKGAVNIPLDSLKNNLSKLKKDRPVITCCASGMRSASAKGLLKANGFVDVYNGGAWVSLNSKI
jgi:rhodanese-related sulfurtransferase